MSYISSEENFFGRTAIQQLLKRRVLDLKEGYRHNLAIVGNQYIGKSSLLRHFVFNLDEDNVVVIYLDLENKDFQYFFEKFIGSLLYNYCASLNIPLHDDLNLLIESAKEYIPQTIQVIKKLQADWASTKTEDVYLGLLSLPEIFTNETGKFCLLIFDEFQNLENFAISDVFVSLGKKIMTQKKCLYIVASSYEGIAKQILTEKLSLLFGNFEIIELDAFDFSNSQGFIESNLKNVKVGGQLRNFLIDFVGGHPLYLNLLCQELINLSAIHKQAEIYLPLLSQAVENTIFDRWGVISRHFELIINELCSGKGNQVLAHILLCIVNGRNKMEEIEAGVNIKKTPLQQKISRLLELGVVVKNGNYYYMKDKLFRYWMKFVYQKRVRDLELSPDRWKKQFKEEFQQCVDNFKNSSRKDLTARMIELLSCFDNESFDLKGRRYRLPLFKEIIPFKVRNDSGVYFDAIKASTDESMWLIVLKQDTFGENDVNALLAEAQKLGKKPERYLIISLTDLDENVKLRALQERFWIWNEGELNTLLTLFGKPYIVR